MSGRKRTLLLSVLWVADSGSSATPNPQDTSAISVVSCAAASDIASFRYNDGACDPQGRFITGLMDEHHTADSGSLHCYGKTGEKTVLLSGIGLPNGVAWSANGDRVYYVDSTARAIYLAEWDADNAQFFAPRLFVETPSELGRPDGIALDIAGNLWVCQFNGGCLLHYSAQGHLLQKIDLPVPRPTSCCFGGEGLATLYITSAKFGLSEQDLRRFPQSGDIFQLPVDIAGLVVHDADERLLSA